MGNRVKTLMEAVEAYRLKLDTRHHLDLLKKIYTPRLSRNLVSLFKLDVTRYSFSFGNGCFSLFKHNHLIGTNVLCDGLYKLKLDGLYAKTFLTLHHNKHSDAILPPRVLDRRLQEAWARATKECPRVLRNLRVDF